MTKSEPKSKFTFPADLYVVGDDALDGSMFFSAATTPDALLHPGDKATIGIYRLVETCEMSAEIVVNRKSVNVTRKPAKK